MRGRGHDIYAFQREKALDLWAAESLLIAAEIAARVGISHAAVETLVKRARKAGDPRAVSRPRGGARTPWCVAFASMRDRGLSLDEMVKASGRTRKRVRDLLRHQDLRAA